MNVAYKWVNGVEKSEFSKWSAVVQIVVDICNVLKCFIDDLTKIPEPDSQLVLFCWSAVLSL